jgi:hypothetical protein
VAKNSPQPWRGTCSHTNSNRSSCLVGDQHHRIVTYFQNSAHFDKLWLPASRKEVKHSVIMAPANSLPSVLNATSNDIEMLLAAQCHIGSKNLQVHMSPYLWKTRADGVNVINIGKTWYANKLGQLHVTGSMHTIANSA